MSHHGQIVTINPEMIEYANKNSDLKKVINNAEMVVPDGIGVQIGLKILGHNVKRVPGVDLGKELLKRANYQKKSVAFIGAKPEVVKKAVNNIKSELADLNVVYSHDGYFENNLEIFNELKSCSPDLVLVALGSPKQEFFISELKSLLPDSVMIGLGGSFDVWAGAVKRAPVIYQKLGLEWLYRTITEPKRFKRIFPALPIFALKVFKERLLNK
jgi:N-acetylglucosaminyldiphosphoundecaprenol N-acetyl-beta-D-mannosaminyltransferase